MKSANIRAASFPGFLDAVLRGIGQIMLQNSRYAGLVFLAGIFYNSVILGCAVLLGTTASTITAILLGADRSRIRAGLFAALEPLGMSALTTPFVLASWLFLLASPLFSRIRNSAAP